jgi:hypothetical protein
MPYEVNENKTYEKSAAAVFDAALKAVAGLEGEVISQKPESGDLEARFDKKILGKVLGDRTHLQAKVAAQSEAASSISIEVYPLDPVGRKLMFGARKGVTNTVMAWFIAHLEHHLAK